MLLGGVGYKNADRSAFRQTRTAGCGLLGVIAACTQKKTLEKFLGTTNTVLCYRLTLRKPFLLLKHCLINMFVTEEASFVSDLFTFTNNAG